MRDEACVVPSLLGPALRRWRGDHVAAAAARDGLAHVHVLPEVRGHERPRHGRLADAHGAKVGARAEGTLLLLRGHRDRVLRGDDVVRSELGLLPTVLRDLLLSARRLRRRRHLRPLLRAPLERARQRFVLGFELGELRVVLRLLLDHVRLEPLRVITPRTAIVLVLRVVWRRRRRSQRPALIMTRVACRSPACSGPLFYSASTSPADARSQDRSRRAASRARRRRG